MHICFARKAVFDVCGQRGGWVCVMWRGGWWGVGTDVALLLIFLPCIRYSQYRVK